VIPFDDINGCTLIEDGACSNQIPEEEVKIQKQNLNKIVDIDQPAKQNFFKTFAQPKV
jgi:hypothetical protein